MEKAVIYQIFTRVCCNSGGKNIPGGDIKTNGSGKLNSYTPVVLDNIKSMGVTHIWFTGLIAHASCNTFCRIGSILIKFIYCQHSILRSAVLLNDELLEFICRNRL